MAGVIWGNLTNRVRRAPPSPPIPLHSTDWGPEGRLFTLDVCVGAHVCLETANIDPNSGLFVGAIGKVIDIVYDKSVGPNGDVDERLPNYIVVDFPSFKPPPGIEPWDRKNPTVSKDSYDREFVTSPLTMYM